MNRRKFHWVSSLSNSDELIDLSKRLLNWYKKDSSRSSYQLMIDDKDTVEDYENNNEYVVPKYIVAKDCGRILEVGCGSGRLYNRMAQLGMQGEYHGLEVSKEIIAQNKNKYPQANWYEGEVYSLPFENNYFDLVFAFYVIEHLIFPEKALMEMLRTIRPGGSLILAFPDFVSAGRFASQGLGFSYGTASQKLKHGKLLDAAVSLLDSRIRLKKALNDVNKACGPFPINLNPLCLYEPNTMSPDIDAVYVASKKEIENWSIANNYTCFYPKGQEGYFSEHAFTEIIK